MMTQPQLFIENPVVLGQFRWLCRPTVYRLVIYVGEGRRLLGATRSYLFRFLEAMTHPRTGKILPPTPPHSYSIIFIFFPFFPKDFDPAFGEENFVGEIDWSVGIDLLCYAVNLLKLRNWVCVWGGFSYLKRKCRGVIELVASDSYIVEINQHLTEGNMY